MSVILVVLLLTFVVFSTEAFRPRYTIPGKMRSLARSLVQYFEKPRPKPGLTWTEHFDLRNLEIYKKAATKLLVVLSITGSHEKIKKITDQIKNPFTKQYIVKFDSVSNKKCRASWRESEKASQKLDSPYVICS